MRQVSGLELVRVASSRLRWGFLLWTVLSKGVFGQGVGLEIQPNSIPVSISYSEVQARVILKNPTSSPIKELKLAAITNDGFEVEIEAQPTTSLAASHSLVWPIKIRNL